LDVIILARDGMFEIVRIEGLSMEVFGCSLHNDLFVCHIDFKVQMREHFFIGKVLRFGPDLFDRVFIFKRLLKLFENLLYAWLVISVPLALTNTLFRHCLIHQGLEVVFMDHLIEIGDNLLLQELCLGG